jgi:hypothetical protein
MQNVEIFNKWNCFIPGPLQSIIQNFFFARFRKKFSGVIRFCEYLLPFSLLTSVSLSSIRKRKNNTECFFYRVP